MDPIAPPPKKGLSGLAKAGIGCLILVVVIVIAVVGVSLWGYHKVAADIDPKNPDKSAALIALKFIPGVEVVSTDDTARTVTIKINKTGELKILSYDDVKNGKLAEKLNAPASPAEPAPTEPPK